MQTQDLMQLVGKRDRLIFEAHQIDRQIKAIEQQTEEAKTRQILALAARRGLSIDQLEKLVFKNAEV